MLPNFRKFVFFVDYITDITAPLSVFSVVPSLRQF